MHIVDARPRVNAIANTAKGAGFESTANYPRTTLQFMDIENIHVVRDSMNKLVAFVSQTRTTDKGWLSGLESTQWLQHLRSVLCGAQWIVDVIHQKGESVLVHCSDGWDRTAQLTALAQLQMDPHYRTIQGFEVLIEKEWLSFGHRFGMRLGLGDKKYNDDQRSPVFVQWMDCVYQLMRQFPTEFEFTEKFLIAILDNMYTCQFGTMLYSCEKQRTEAMLKERTVSMWSALNAQKYGTLL